MTHEYRRFIQAELDARGWSQADLVRSSGLRRQLIWKILHDDRDNLGQMPEQSTLEGIARGFGIPVERVRLAASRAVDGYVNDGIPETPVPDASKLPTDVLLEELRRRTASHRRVAAGGDEPEENADWGQGFSSSPADDEPRMHRNQQRL